MEWHTEENSQHERCTVSNGTYWVCEVSGKYYLSFEYGDSAGPREGQTGVFATAELAKAEAEEIERLCDNLGDG